MKNMHVYNLIAPPPFMEDYIKTFWTFSYDQFVKQKYSILPDGYFDLMYIFEGDKLVNTSLTGLWENKVDITYTKPVKVLGIRFKPAAATTIFKFPINEIINSSIALDNNELIPSAEQLANIVPFKTSDGIRLIQDYYSDKISRNVDSGKLNLFKHLDSSQGLQSLDSLTLDMGISPRQLQRKINNIIGIPPKKYLKILRFRNYCENAVADTYYDQSHLIKDFKQFCEESPEKIKNKKGVRFLQYNNFFNK
ncbi:MAG: helix-turn-helix domain-containing protein [Spirochaetales bacterium]|nr:helix-turn-helix domain-containing protein [Spirochaetales bacterium]